MLKKYFLVKFVVIFSVISIPFQASAAPVVQYGAGEWDYIGYAQNVNLYYMQVDVTQTVSSGGGNLQIRVSDADVNNRYSVWLFEKDSGDTSGTLIGRKYGYGNDTLTWDVSSFAKEESDGRAEIYAHIGYAEIEEPITIRFYD